jgi:hypothetical protein
VDASKASGNSDSHTIHSQKLAVSHADNQLFQPPPFPSDSFVLEMVKLSRTSPEYTHCNLCDKGDRFVAIHVL